MGSWLPNVEIGSFQSAHSLPKLLSELDFGLGDNSWIEDHSHILRTLYYSDMFKCIQFLLSHHWYEAHLHVKLMLLAESGNCRKHSEMNTGDCCCNSEDQISAKVMIVPVICASDKTHLTNSLCDHQVWPMYRAIGTIQQYLWQIPWEEARILVGLNLWTLNGANNPDSAWRSAVGTVPSSL